MSKRRQPTDEIFPSSDPNKHLCQRDRILESDKSQSSSSGQSLMSLGDTKSNQESPRNIDMDIICENAQMSPTTRSPHLSSHTTSVDFFSYVPRSISAMDKPASETSDGTAAPSSNSVEEETTSSCSRAPTEYTVDGDTLSRFDLIHMETDEESGQLEENVPVPTTCVIPEISVTKATHSHSSAEGLEPSKETQSASIQTHLTPSSEGTPERPRRLSFEGVEEELKPGESSKMTHGSKSDQSLEQRENKGIKRSRDSDDENPDDDEIEQIRNMRRRHQTRQQ